MSPFRRRHPRRRHRYFRRFTFCRVAASPAQRCAAADAADAASAPQASFRRRCRRSMRRCLISPRAAHDAARRRLRDFTPPVARARYASRHAPPVCERRAAAKMPPYAAYALSLERRFLLPRKLASARSHARSFSSLPRRHFDVARCRAAAAPLPPRRCVAVSRAATPLTPPRFAPALQAAACQPNDTPPGATSLCKHQ